MNYLLIIKSVIYKIIKKKKQNNKIHLKTLRLTFRN